MADVSTFVDKTLKLLNLEREAEVNETRAFYESADNATLEKKGVCLTKLVVFSRRTGLYGRTLLSLGKRKTNRNVAESSLPAHCITPGDIVGLSYSSGDSNVSELSSGIVTRVSSSSLVVAFDESLDVQSFDEDALLRVTRLANDITYKRMKRVLGLLCNGSSFPCSHLVDVLFGSVPMGEPLNLSSLVGQPENNASTIDWFFNRNLNESQQMAVQFALTCKEIGVIHGPPGTGKTTTVVEVIIQAVKNCHLKVLACAPSNIAVDNIVERLAAHKIKAVRLGHPARVLEKIHGYSLDAILDSSDGTALVKDVRKDIDMTQSKLKSCRNPGERSRLRSEMKSLRQELREREGKAMKEILLNADVILSTNISASEDGPLKHVPNDHFDLVIIDEAAQSLEAACWVPLLWAPRCILAGDHQQLPPTILSREAAKQGLEQTLMERVIKLLGDSVVHMLTTQYRMNEKIMKWSSEQLYEGRLSADECVSEHLLRDLPEVSDTEVTSMPLLLIDTAGCDMYELQTSEEESKGNEGEAEVVVQHIEALINSGVKHSNIGVITPYNLQVELLRCRLSTKYPALEIKSVDGFQGREKEAIIISLVRSNNRGEVGFLAENRRINVAVTRARRHLTVVGDSSTVSRDPFLNSLVEYIGEHGEVWSAEQYRNQMSGDPVFSRVNKTVGQRVVCNKSKNQNKNSSKEKSDKKNGSKNKDKKNDKNESRKAKETQKKLQNGKEVSKTIRDGDVTENIPGTSKDTEERRGKLEKQIKVFVKDEGRSELDFPTNLTSEERFMVHCIAEELGLDHVSKGTGQERFIVVTKVASRLSKGLSGDDFMTDGAEAVPKSVEENRKDKTSSCTSCGKLIPSCNIGLHEVRCQREKQRARKEKTTPLGQQKSSKKGTKLPGEKMLAKKKANSQNDEDLDELLAGFVLRDSQCAMRGCKNSILTVGQKCRYCTNCYCLGHHIPEVHGCAQAAKERARRELNATATGNHKQSSSRTVTKKAHLHRTLENKLKDLEGKRKAKQSQDQKR